MFNKNSKMGKNVMAARRLAAILMAGTLAGTIAVGSAPAVIVSAATWQENADYIFEYLTKRLKYSEAAACGIMANIRCESTFNPHAWNAGGGSYGLCQWTGGRYGRLQSWCGSNGYDYTTIDGQLAYLEYELQNYYPGVENYLRSVENNRDGAYNAGQYYCYHFEAPASRGSVSVYRGGLASGTYWESYRPAEWYLVDGAWRYVLRDGSYHTGWLTLDKQTFYLDKEGRRVSGWNTIDGKRYYFDEKGAMITGWYKVDGRNYYFAKDGSLVTGVVRDDSDLYPVDNYGGIQGAAAMGKYAPEWIAREEKRKAELASAEADDKKKAVADLKDGKESTLAQAGKDEKVVTQAEESEAAASDNADEDIKALATGGNESAPEDASQNTNSAGSFSGSERVGDKQLASSEADGSSSLASSKKNEPKANLETDSSAKSTAALQDQGNLNVSEEEEQFTLAAEAMRTAAENLNEDSGEEPEARAFVTPGDQENEAVPESAAAVQDDKEKAGTPKSGTIAGDGGEKEETLEAATTVQDSEEKAEIPDDSEKIAAGITAPFAQAESGDAAEKSTSEAEWNLPFGLPGLNSNTTGNGSDSRENTNAPVYSLPFSYTDASNMLGKDDNNESEKEASDSETVSADVVEKTNENTADSEEKTEENTTASFEKSDEEKAESEEKSDEDKAESEEKSDEDRAESEEKSDENNGNNNSGDGGFEEEKDQSEQSSDEEDEAKGETEPGDTGDKDETEPDDTEDKDETEPGDTEYKDEEESGNTRDENESEAGRTEDEVEDEENKSEDPENQDDMKQPEDASESKTGESAVSAEAESEKAEDEAEDKDEAEDRDETEDKDKSEDESIEEPEEELEKDEAGEEIRIILKKDIPDISRDEMDDLVEILRKKNILHAVSGNGLNITPKVKASFEQDEGDNYTVTFSVEYNGSEAELESSVRITD